MELAAITFPLFHTLFAVPQIYCPLVAGAANAPEETAIKIPKVTKDDFIEIAPNKSGSAKNLEELF